VAASRITRPVSANVPDLLSASDRALAVGDWVQAIDGYRAALSHSVGLATPWFNLAYALRAVSQFESALEAYASAIDLGIEGPEEAHVNRAAIYSEHLHRPLLAQVELEKALAIRPHFLPALLNFGLLQEDMGNLPEARVAYERVLSIDPSNGRALLRLTMLSLHDSGGETIIPRLRQALQAPSLAQDDRCDVAFALANALDNAGQYDDAWDMLMAANKMEVATTHPRLLYDRVAHDQLIDALCKLPAIPTVSYRNGAPDKPKLIFICGMFRSGSTLAEQILSRHPLVMAAGELEFIPQIANQYVRPYPRHLLTTAAKEVIEWRSEYMSRLSAIVEQAPFVTDKRCDNFLYIPLIKSMFPDAKIVHTSRDWRDVLLSTLFLRFGDGVRYGNRIEDFTHWHVSYQRLMAHWNLLYSGDDIVDLNYDELVKTPELTIRKLLSQLDLPWDEACLSVGGRQRIITASSWQVRQPLYSNSSGRWHPYAKQLQAAGLNI
jgi:tetratricopeptide (TPR) repeat protein